MVALRFVDAGEESIVIAPCPFGWTVMCGAVLYIGTTVVEIYFVVMMAMIMDVV